MGLLSSVIHSFPSQFGHSTSNLMDLLHGGRPKDEEPHVKRSLAKKDNEGIEYICRVNLEDLGITDEEFDDLQSLFEVDIYMI